MVVIRAWTGRGRLRSPRWQAGLYTLIALLLLGGCGGTGVVAARPVTVTLGGATGMQPVLQELTAEFSRRQPHVRFELRGGGSQFGEEQTLAGRLNLGATVLPPSPEDNASVSSERSPRPIDADLTRIPIGIDGLALIGHPGVGVEMLTGEQVALIFEGRILNWAEVGGADGEILLVSREDGSGARRIFEERIMGATAVALTAVVMPTSQDVVRYVARTPGAVGYVSRAFVLGHLPDAANDASGTTVTAVTTAQATGSPPVRVIGLDGHWPVDAAIQNQLYPLSYPIYLVSRREPIGAMRQFVDFALSPAGQAIVGRYHVRVR